MTIQLDGVVVSTTMRTPGHDFELAAGFCLTEGLLAGAGVVGVATAPTTPRPRPRSTRSPSRPAASRRNPCRGSGTVSSSCGWCGSDQIEALVERLTPLPPSAPIPPAVLAGVPDRVLGGQGLFTKTGAVHAARCSIPTARCC